MIDGKMLRKDKLKLRDNLDKKLRTEKSGWIENKLFGLEEVLGAKKVFIYVSFRSEVETFNIIERFMDNGLKICVPITLVDEKKMEAIDIESISEDLEPGYCGIPEPRKQLLASRTAEPETIDVVIVPGSVFDEQGGRFGYGGGYYDRFLQKIPEAVRIGIAFDCQVVEKAPLQDHDELLDYVITESRIIKGERSRS